MFLEKIVDRKFAVALCKAVLLRGPDRRFQIHFGDSLYCSLNAVIEKVLPSLTADDLEEYDRDKYRQALRYMSGHGTQFGIVNALKSASEVVTKLSESQGHIDFVFVTPREAINDHIQYSEARDYELKTWRFFSPDEKYPESHVIVQSCRYLASRNKPFGYIKIIDPVWVTDSTWRVHLRDMLMERYRNSVINAENRIKYSMLTGDVSKLRKASCFGSFWVCNFFKCDLCHWIRHHPNTFYRSWLQWKKDRKVWLKAQAQSF